MRQEDLAIQIQENFSNLPLGTLAEAGLSIYELIPDYRECCPICRGKDCAVRNGLYYRQVVDQDGSLYPSFPIPRFRCCRRGPNPRTDATFSVLPAQLVSRRRPSLPLMMSILQRLLLTRHSIQSVLDGLNQTLSRWPVPWVPEPVTIYRILHLFAEADKPLAVVCRFSGQPTDSLRVKAKRVLLNLLAGGTHLVLNYHRIRFPHLLFNATR